MVDAEEGWAGGGTGPEDEESARVVRVTAPSIPVSDDCVQPTPPCPTFCVKVWMVAAAPADASIVFGGISAATEMTPIKRDVRVVPPRVVRQHGRGFKFLLHL